MRGAIVLGGIAALLLLAASGQAASLNKCIDAQGKVTYSNLPCHNARESRTVEIDPAPPAPPAQRTPPEQSAKATQEPAPKPALSREGPATVRLESRSVSSKSVKQTSARQCDALADKLGRVFDKMDAGRRKGYTQEQMNAWNEEVKDLERRKQESGCF